MKVDVLAILIFLMTLFMSCEKAPYQEGSADEPDLPNVPFELTKSQEEFVEDNNEFAFDLLVGLMDDSQCRNENFMVSPLSAGFLLSALNNGAQGQTSKQILAALGYEDYTLAQVNEYCRLLLEGSGAVDRKVNVGIHNALIINDDYSLKPAFAESLTSYYDAYVQSADFSKKTTLDMINDWCNKKSNGLIPSVVEELNLNAVIYALNCIYFKAGWSNKFLPENTEKENFTDIEDKTQQVMMMNAEDRYLLSENGTWKTLALPFSNGQYKMYILLPEEGKNISDLKGVLNEDSWESALSSMKSRMVNLKLPKFETATSVSMNSVLKGLGMTDAFDKSMADFGAMVNSGNVFISLIKQDSRFKIDEEGTEAAAITSVILDLGTAMPGQQEPVEFHADRPFIYLIQEKSSGAIFFAGVKCK